MAAAAAPLRRHGSTLTSVVIALIATASTAGASTLDLFGFGGRSPGLGGNGVATSSNYEALFVNPAGLGLVDHTELTFGALYGDLRLEVDDRDQNVDPALGTVFAATARLRLGGWLEDRVSLGIGAFVPTKAIAQARWPVLGEPVFAVLGSRSQVINLQFGLGLAVTDRLRVGVSVITLAGLGGGIFVSADAGGQFTSTSEQSLIARAAPIVGVQYSLPAHDLELGAVFRAESDATFDVLIDNDLINELPLTIPPLNIGGIAQFDPQTFAVEAAWRPAPSLQGSLQLAYYRWSEFGAPLVNPVPGQPPTPDPEFRDTVVPRLSAEWRATTAPAVLDVRGGYSFVMTPAPEMTGQQSLLDNHRHVLSAGLGVAWPGQLPIRFDLWVQGHLLQPRTHEKNPNRFSDPDAIPFDRIDTSGHIVVGGLSMGVEL